jgi:hypothetical protein
MRCGGIAVSKFNIGSTGFTETFDSQIHGCAPENVRLAGDERADRPGALVGVLYK